MKAIFIDGANLSHMARALEIETLDYRSLYHILTEQIGKTDKDGRPVPIAKKPLITVSTSKIYSSPRFIDYLAGIGYECAPYDKGTGDDDRLLTERMLSIGPEVTQVLLVSSDSDYFSTMKAMQDTGIDAVWIGTNEMMGTLIKIFFTPIVELGDFADALGRRTHTP